MFNEKEQNKVLKKYKLKKAPIGASLKNNLTK